MAFNYATFRGPCLGIYTTRISQFKGDTYTSFVTLPFLFLMIATLSAKMKQQYKEKKS